MFSLVGFALLFFLPVIESFSRTLGFTLLLSGSLFLFLPIVFRKKISFDLLDTLFLMCLTAFSISTIFSWSIGRSFTELIRYIAYFLIFISIRNNEILFPEFKALNSGNMTFGSAFLIRWYVPMILINTTVLSLLSLFSSLPQVTVTPSEIGMNLFYPVFGHNRIANILIFAIPLAATYFLSKSEKKEKLIFFLLTLFFFGILFLSLGRGAIVSLTFAFLFSLFLFRLRNEKWNRFLSIFTLSTILFLLSSFIYSNFSGVTSQSTNIVKGLYKPVSDEHRFFFLEQGRKGFLSSPLVGTGLDTFRYVSQRYQARPLNWSWYLHNHYLELFIEAGFVAGLLFLAFFFTSFRNGYRFVLAHLGENKLYLGVFIGLLASSIHSLIDFDWHFLSIFLFFFAGFALLLPYVFPAKNIRLGLSPFLFVLILFSFSIFSPLDSDAALGKGEIAFQKKEYEQAFSLLYRAYRLDYAYDQIPKKFASFYNRLNNDSEARFWQNEARKRNPLDPVE